MVKFLIIRFSSIGDIVLTTPVIRMLKKQVKDAEIHFLTKPAFKEILSPNPYITKIHLLSEQSWLTVDALKKEEFDYIIDLQNSLRSGSIKRSLKRMYFTVNKINIKKWLFVNFKIDKLPNIHIVDRYLKTIELFDIKNDNAGLDYFLPKGESVSLSELPSEFSNGFIALVIGAQHFTKKLPTEKISEIIEKTEHPVVLIGGQEDQKNGETVLSLLPHKHIYNGCGKWTINQSASIIKQANCVITHDTGMMHIAAAFRKKIITVWGNTTPRFGMYSYMPDPQSINFEVQDLRCRPCSKLGKTSCPKNHFKCMKDQDANEIAKAANNLF